MEETDRVGERIFDQHALRVAGQQRLGGSVPLIGEQDGRFLVPEIDGVAVETVSQAELAWISTDNR